MSNNALYTIEQVDNKLIITVELVKAEHPNPTMIRSNDGNTETIEFVNPPLNINTNQCGGLDLSKYKPFPAGYKIPEETKVIAICDDRIETDPDYSKGKKGITKNAAAVPSVLFEDGNRVRMNSHELAPLDPSDHPDYKPEQPETRPMNADEIAEWVRRCIISNIIPSQLTQHINALVQYELNKAKR